MLQQKKPSLHWAFFMYKVLASRRWTVHFATAGQGHFSRFELPHCFKTIARTFNIKRHFGSTLLGHHPYHQGLLKLMVLRTHLATLAAHRESGKAAIGVVPMAGKLGRSRRHNHVL